MTDLSSRLPDTAVFKFKIIILLYIHGLSKDSDVYVITTVKMIYTNFIHSLLVQDFTSNQELCEPVSLWLVHATRNMQDTMYVISLSNISIRKKF
jgi:hypothetical protein